MFLYACQSALDFHLLELAPCSDDVLAVWTSVHPTTTTKPKSTIGEHDEEGDGQLYHLLEADSTSPLVTFYTRRGSLHWLRWESIVSIWSGIFLIFFEIWWRQHTLNLFQQRGMCSGILPPAASRWRLRSARTRDFRAQCQDLAEGALGMRMEAQNAFLLLLLKEPQNVSKQNVLRQLECSRHSRRDLENHCFQPFFFTLLQHSVGGNPAFMKECPKEIWFSWLISAIFVVGGAY